MAKVSLVKLPSDDCYCTLLTIGQHWFRWWLVAWWQQAITWANVDLDLSRHMVSLGCIKLTRIFWYGCVARQSDTRIENPCQMTWICILFYFFGNRTGDSSCVWCDDIETLSALFAFSEGNPPVTVNFLTMGQLYWFFIFSLLLGVPQDFLSQVAWKMKIANFFDISTLFSG